MSKKQDFIAREQSRDKHPERLMTGSGAEVAARGAQAKGNPAGHQQPQVGKVANDHNKQGKQPPTQTHQHERTPQSRHDREDKAGAHNQASTRRGGAGGGRGPDGAG